MWVCVVGEIGSSDVITGVTYNGVAMTLCEKLAGGDRYSYLFYLVAAASGANDVVVSASGSTFMAANVSDYDGASQTGIPDAESTTTVGDVIPQVSSVTTVGDNCWVVGTNQSYLLNIAPTAVSGCTRRGYETAFGTIGLFDNNAAKTPAGTVTFETKRSDSSSPTAKLIMASFAPAGAAAATYNYLTLLGVG